MLVGGIARWWVVWAVHLALGNKTSPPPLTLKIFKHIRWLPKLGRPFEFGVLITRESYYLGSILGVPHCRKTHISASKRSCSLRDTI